MSKILAIVSFSPVMNVIDPTNLNRVGINAPGFDVNMICFRQSASLLWVDTDNNGF